MSSQRLLTVLGAVCAVLLLTLLQQWSAPAVSSTRLAVGSGVESALRTAVGEMRQIRAQLARLEARAHELEGPGAARTTALAPALAQPAPNARPDRIATTASSASAPSSFLDAVALDDRSGANFSRLTAVTGSQPTCGLLLFRHVEKTGGTTFRMHMVALHDCGWHVWGYKGAIRLCNKAKAEWAMLREPGGVGVRADGTALLPHLTVESHAETHDFVHMLDTWKPMVQAWRGRCPFWLISILREPLNRQVSHYSYHKTTRGFDIKHIHNFTHYFNDQSMLVNRRTTNNQFLQRHILLPRLLDLEMQGSPVAELRAYTLGELDKFDAIGVFENYTASMLLVARVTGLPLSKYSAPSTAKNRNIKPHRSKVKQIWAEELATPAQRAYFERHLELDFWLYREVRRRFEAQVRALGEGFDAQLRELLGTDTALLDASLDKVCSIGCDSKLDKEQSTNRFVWKDQECWPPAERELASCGKDQHLNPNFNYMMCG